MPIRSHISHLQNYRSYLSVVNTIDRYLQDRSFLKLDLPVMLPALIPESYLEVFETEYRYFDTRQKLYLTPSPELLIKRLLVDGIGNCYYMGKSFRNSEPASSKHLGEFTMLELYRVDADYMEIADTVLELLQRIAFSVKRLDSIKKNQTITYQDIQIDLGRWEKMTVAEAFQKYASIRPEELFDHEAFRAAAKRKGYQTEKTSTMSSRTDNMPAIRDLSGSGRQTEMKSPNLGPNTQNLTPNTYAYDELWSQIYATEVEPHLGMHGHPTLLYDYPVEFAALSQPNPDGQTAQRFEFYIAGVELGNCYSELADWSLQEKRLQDEERFRAESGKISHPSDEGFIEALQRGLPRCAGIAIGVERLAMIFADVPSITDLKLVTF